MIIEKLTGTRLEVVIQRRILNRLGMFDTRFPTRPGMRDPFAHGYTGEPGALLDYTRSNPEVPWAAGAMTSTLDDLRVWAKALGTGVPLLKARTQKARLPNVVIETQPIELKYGLGMFSIQGFLGHNGAVFGYSNTVLYLPETGATIVVWTNLAANELGHSDEATVQIAQLLYPERFP